MATLPITTQSSSHLRNILWFTAGLLILLPIIMALNQVSANLLLAATLGIVLLIATFISIELNLYLLIGSILLFSDQTGIDLPGATTISLFDLLLVISLAAWFLRILLGANGITSWRFIPPLLLLWFFSAIGVWTALQNGVPLKPALWEVRPIFYYVLIFPVAYQCRDIGRIKRVVMVLLICALILAVRDIGMYLSGKGLIAPGAAGLTGSTLRVVTQELYIVSYVIILIGAIFLFDRNLFRRGLYLVFLFLAFLPLVFSYTRNVWVGFAASIVTLFFLVPTYIRIKLLLALFILGMAGIFITAELSLLGIRTQRIDIAEVVVKRIKSINPSTAHQDLSSLQRIGEYKASWKTIQAHPLTGIGWGNYQYLFHYDSGRYVRWAFVHNGFLFILLKAGLPALLCYLWLSFSFFRLGMGTYRETTVPYFKGLVAGAICAVLGGFVTSLFTEKIINYKFAPFLAILFGLVLAVSLIISKQEEQAKEPVPPLSIPA